MWKMCGECGYEYDMRVHDNSCPQCLTNKKKGKDAMIGKTGDKKIRLIIEGLKETVELGEKFVSSIKMNTMSYSLLTEEEREALEYKQETQKLVERLEAIQKELD